MREEILKQFFEGKINAKFLAKDLKNSMITKQDITQHPIEDISGSSQVLPVHLVRLCDAVLAGQIKPQYLQSIGFCILASDNFEYDTDTTEGNLVGDTCSDWSAPKINYALTKRNVEKFRERLTTGNDPFTLHGAR